MIGATIAVNEGEAVLGPASQRALGEHCMTVINTGQGSRVFASVGAFGPSAGNQLPTDQQRSVYRAVRR